MPTDRQLKLPRRRGSLAPREGEVRHKKNKRRAPTERVAAAAPRGVGGSFNVGCTKREVPQRAMPRHATRRARQVALAGGRSSTAPPPSA